MQGSDVIVVGGGVVGCAAAYFLARERVAVTLLERDDLALHASGAAAGMLLPTGEARGPGPLLSWGMRSLELFPELTAELCERTGIDPEFVASGALHVALSEAEAQALCARAAALPGCELEWLDAGAARVAEPQLAPHIRGALWSPREAHVRSPLLARGLAAAAAQLGARLETGCAVVGLRREGTRVCGVVTPSGDRSAECVVLCTGAWAAECARWLGVDWKLPVEPVRGQILALEAPRPSLHSMLAGEGTYLVQKRDGTVVVGSTEERVGFDCRVTAQGVAELLNAAPRLVPALGACGFRTTWAGLRPATPDGLPVIGPLPGIEGLLVAAGHFRNGVLLSPVTGWLLADQVLGKGAPADAAAFRAERFLTS